VGLMTLMLMSSVGLSECEAHYNNSEKTGLASWYGGGEKLNEFMANGQKFDPEALTCAAWGYPFGTKLLVTSWVNGKSIIVVATDRGPSKTKYPNRIIDLTKEAFSRIADLDVGIIPVTVGLAE